MSYGTVFVVSADAAIRDSLSELVASAGLPVETFPAIDTWLETVQPARQGCLVLDARPRDLAGSAPLARFACVCARYPILVLIERGDVPLAVHAVKAGVLDVVEKPCRAEDLLHRIRRAALAAQNAAASPNR